MDSDNDSNHDQVVERLTTGFGAMLEQVQELARRNLDLEQRLAHVREDVRRPSSLYPWIGTVCDEDT